jgi:membrane dipeptidase
MTSPARRLEWTDHRQDPAAWATSLGISREAVDLYLASDVVDLHVDTFLLNRFYGYDLTKRHPGGFHRQVDLPRVREVQLSGALWAISTNPLYPQSRRPGRFLKNLTILRGILESCPDDVAIVRNLHEYRAARAAGKHAAFIAIQGGNALDHPGALDLIPDDLVVRITLLHLASSSLGTTSSPLHSNRTLTPRGVVYVEQLNHKRIFVDLAHSSRKTFFDVLKVHDRTQPVIVTHTGVSGAFPHWRNLDDEQVRAIADLGGTIGIMYQASFLGDRTWNGRAETIVRHLAHIVDTVGEDHASLGSDWDGLIVPPRDMPTCLELPKLVQLMLDRGWAEGRIRKILGGNFLRALGQLRP